jgi:hypothetical protein
MWEQMFGYLSLRSFNQWKKHLENQRPPGGKDVSNFLIDILMFCECHLRGISMLSMQGLEKYLMTKLFTRAFAPLPEDADQDQRLSEKMSILQKFIRPEHLDISESFQNETSWLVWLNFTYRGDVC